MFSYMWQWVGISATGKVHQVYRMLLRTGITENNSDDLFWIAAWLPFDNSSNFMASKAIKIK